MHRSKLPFNRTFFGYDELIVSGVLSELERFYAVESERLTTRAGELNRAIQNLKVGIALAEPVVPTGFEHVQGSPDAIRNRTLPRAARMVPQPTLRRFRRTFLGLDPQAVTQTVQETVRSGQAALERLQEALLAADAEYERLLLRMDQLKRQIRLAQVMGVAAPADAAPIEAASPPVAAPAAPTPPPALVATASPLPEPSFVSQETPPAARYRAEGKLILLPTREQRSQAAPADRPASSGSGRSSWRPGAVEEDWADEGPASAPANRFYSLPVSQVAVAMAPVPEVVLPPVEPQAVPVPKVEAAPAPEAPVQTPVPAPHKSDLAGDQVKSGIVNRIDVLYSRFLTGKVVGADLYLPDGELLAARGTHITRELVDRAETQGLLAAMIAAMTFPGSQSD